MDALSDVEQEASPDSQASPGQQLQQVVVPILEKTLGEMTATQGNTIQPQDPNPSATTLASPETAVQEGKAGSWAGNRCITVHSPFSPVSFGEQLREFIYSVPSALLFAEQDPGTNSIKIGKEQWLPQDVCTL